MSNSKWCTIETDGASKGNPGRAGAGAVLKDASGRVITTACEGLGYATNNEAEYKGLNLGMRTALERGYTDVTVKTDSQLVANQVKGEWQTRNPNMRDLCTEAIGLKDGFRSFEMQHHPRGFNSDADTQANLGANLPRGEVHYDDE